MTACERALAPDVDAVIALVPEPQRTVVLALRSVVREAAPDLDESVKWGKPVYGRGTANLLSIIAHRTHVNLQLFNGATLPDPEGLLEGIGKGLRHVKCRTIADVARPGVRTLIERCAAASPA
ncbi:MAG TPA: DUF1801 domain-containing protein [Salinarimonas sp.]|nr:DUF1801 domain-containing protein [Salinarimonas sp.]